MNLISTSSGFTSTAMDFVSGIDLSGQRPVVTGAALFETLVTQAAPTLQEALR